MIRVVGKVVLWAAVFGSAAGIGAFIAAHTEPFPPTADPGNSFTPTSSPQVQQPKWRVEVDSSTRHDYYTAGFAATQQSCVSRFRTIITIGVDQDSGKVTGSGTVKRTGNLNCTFQVVQIEVDQIGVKVVGTYQGGASALIRLVERTRSPVGSDDFGGFTHTVLGGGSRSAFDIPIPTTTADQTLSFKRSVPDGDRGFYRSDNAVTVSCVKGCESGA